VIERLIRYRYQVFRRLTQAGIVALFVAGFRWDWTLGGLEPVAGNLSASRLFGAVPLADPFAAVQIGLTGHGLLSDAVLGALIVAGFYLLVGGRAFCAWVCPMNVVTDAAGALRRRLSPGPGLRGDRRLRYGALSLALALSAVTGVAAFEWVSPVGMLQRGLIYGMGWGWLAVLAVFLFDALLLRHGWCGHLCPLGAFYSLLGRFSPLRVRFAPERCDSCGVCHQVCPEPQVLPLRALARRRWVTSGNCTNCGECIAACPQDCFAFGVRGWRRPAPPQALARPVPAGPLPLTDDTNPPGRAART